MNFLSKHYRDSIDACYKVVAACERCADTAETLTMHEAARECADIAALCLRLLDRQSLLAADIVASCIKACRACATECARFDTQGCQACLDACNQCIRVLADNARAIATSREQREVSAHVTAH